MLFAMPSRYDDAAQPRQLRVGSCESHSLAAIRGDVRLILIKAGANAVTASRRWTGLPHSRFPIFGISL
jgi:hypothetical protein